MFLPKLQREKNLDAWLNEVIIASAAQSLTLSGVGDYRSW